MNNSFNRYHHWEVDSIRNPENHKEGMYYLRLFIGHDRTDTVIIIKERGALGNLKAYKMAQVENQKLRDEGKLYG